jgi:hypothetical protein
MKFVGSHGCVVNILVWFLTVAGVAFTAKALEKKAETSQRTVPISFINKLPFDVIVYVKGSKNGDEKIIPDTHLGKQQVSSVSTAHNTTQHKTTLRPNATEPRQSFSLPPKRLYENVDEMSPKTTSNKQLYENVFTKEETDTPSKKDFLIATDQFPLRVAVLNHRNQEVIIKFELVDGPQIPAEVIFQPTSGKRAYKWTLEVMLPTSPLGEKK